MIKQQQRGKTRFKMKIRRILIKLRTVIHRPLTPMLNLIRARNILIHQNQMLKNVKIMLSFSILLVNVNLSPSHHNLRINQRYNFGITRSI